MFSLVIMTEPYAFHDASEIELTEYVQEHRQENSPSTRLYLVHAILYMVMAAMHDACCIHVRRSYLVHAGRGYGGHAQWCTLHM